METYEIDVLIPEVQAVDHSVTAEEIVAAIQKNTETLPENFERCRFGQIQCDTGGSQKLTPPRSRTTRSEFQTSCSINCKCSWNSS